MNAERVHHPFSPSRLSALEQCPCQESRDTSGVAAATGVIQHRVTETGIDDLRLSDDEALAAAECLDFVERQKTLLEEARNRDGSPEEILEIKERYLPIDDLKLEWGGATYDGTTGGFCDEILVSHDRKKAVLIDHKFGAWAVDPAKDNPQGVAYSLGLFKLFPALESIQVYFLQPKLNLITSAVFTRADIPRLYSRVVTIVARAVEAQTKKDWAAAKPSYPNCLFCGAIGRCHKWAEFALQVSKKFYPLSGVPENITPTHLLAPAESAALLRMASIVEVWAKAVRTQTTDRVLRGDVAPPENHKLDKRVPREIVDKTKFRDVALRFVTEQEYFETLTPAFGAVENLVKERAPRGFKKAALESLDKQWREVGAVVDGQSYAFLRAVSKADE